MIDQTLTFAPSATDAGRRLAIRLANPLDAGAHTGTLGQTNFDRVRLVRVTPLNPEIQTETDNPKPETPR
jgi:hypothetical protein